MVRPTKRNGLARTATCAVTRPPAAPAVTPLITVTAGPSSAGARSPAATADPLFPPHRQARRARVSPMHLRRVPASATSAPNGPPFTTILCHPNPHKPARGTVGRRSPQTQPPNRISGTPAATSAEMTTRGSGQTMSTLATNRIEPRANPVLRGGCCQPRRHFSCFSSESGHS